MNRQRRMEAIARQRAFIDNQIKILSSANEARIPNIIRNRAGTAGRSQHSSIRHRPIQFMQEFETIVVDPVPHAMGIDFDQELVEDSNDMPQIILPQLQPENGFQEGMYVTLVDQNSTCEATNSVVESFVEQQEPSNNNTLVPIEIPGDIVQLLANEQLPQSFQTFQTDDGTIMLVLEGNEFANKQVNTQTQPDHFTGVSDSTTGEQNSEETGEETYVIVQTPDGEVLIPTSMAVPESQTNETCNIFNLVDEEAQSTNLVTFPQSAALQPQITTTRIRTKVPKLSHSNTFLKTKSIKTNPKQKLIRKRVQVSNVPKFTIPYPNVKQENPGPFRFEMPEFEDDECQNTFISVPIPIKIDSLCSQRKNISEDCADQLPDSDSKSLADHKEVHQELQLLNCGQCFEKFESEIGFVNHKQLHEQETLKCNNCQKWFEYQSELKSHLNYCGVETLGKVEFPVAVIKPEHIEQFEIESTDMRTNGTEINIIENQEVPTNVTNHCKDASHSGILEIVHKYSVSSGKDTPESLQNELQSGGPPKKKIKQLLFQNIDTFNKESTLTLSSADRIEHSSLPGRRTLFKTTAKATMSKVDVHVDVDLWEPKRISNNPATVENEYVNGALVSEKSARIRARHSRIKAMDGKAPNEEEIEVNFRNIFQNVVKHGPT